MKKSISILVLTMITFMGYSQEPNQKKGTIELEDVVITSLNPEYLVLIQDDMTPREVANLQLKAANYDVSEHLDFSEVVITDDYEVAFKNSKGAIHAFYNNDGKIETAFERFNDIVLPRKVLMEILESYRDWNIVGNLYLSNYDGKKDNLTRSYNVDLQKGLYKKSIKIDASKK